MNRLLLIALFVTLAVLSAFGSQVLVTETFDNDVFTNGKWILSKQSKYAGQPVKILPTGEDYPGLENDKGVQLSQEMKHYGFGLPFSEPINFKGKDIFIQYEVKFLETFNCGGAYIKLLRGGAPLEELDGSTPYSIMFGPDKCGATNKVHFIVQYQNPIDQSWEEKHFNETIPVKTDKKTHLYTLAIHPDSSFAIAIDHKEIKKGSLLTHLVPSVNPEAQISDPTDKKPTDWVDEKEILDMTASKPEDWDESQPRKIVDEKAVKPAGWLDSEPETIPNPDAIKPEDWDDEEVGLKHFLFCFQTVCNFSFRFLYLCC
jgi:calnexin